MKAVEKARELEELSEVDDKDGLFVVEPLSKDDDTYFVDLREDGIQFYGYGVHEKIPEDKQKDEPRCVKVVRSFYTAEGSKTLSQFTGGSGE